MPKCQHPNGIIIKPDGVNELDPCVYEDIEVYKNVTVTISRCMNCGNIEISWQRQPETECLHHENAMENWDKKSIILSPTNIGFTTNGIFTGRIDPLMEAVSLTREEKAEFDRIYNSLSEEEKKVYGYGTVGKYTTYAKTLDGAFIVLDDYGDKYKEAHPYPGKYIGIAATKESRGKGITDKLISMAKRDNPNDDLIAIIENDNQASIRLFTRNGFKLAHKKDGFGWYIFKNKKSTTNEGGFNTMGIATNRVNSLLEAGMNQTKPKSLSDIYLYSKVSDYETKLIKFIMEADRIDTNSEAFADLLYDIKRRSVNNSLIKVLLSKNIVFGVSNDPLSGAFKVFTAKDIKSKEKNVKVFVDLTGIVTVKNGVYSCPIQKVDHIVSHLVSAACQRIYHGAPDKFINNTTIISCGSEIFAKMVNYVIDFLYKVNTIPVNKQKLEYMSSMYYQLCILNKEYSERIRAIAIKQARISEKEADLIDIHTPKEAYDNINEFIQAVAKVLHLDKLTLEIFLNKWIFLYGVGTQFATEIFYAFSSMITNAYVGAYINNQKTIEKVIGQDLVEFTTKILEIESGVLDG